LSGHYNQAGRSKINNDSGNVLIFNEPGSRRRVAGGGSGRPAASMDPFSHTLQEGHSVQIAHRTEPASMSRVRPVGQVLTQKYDLANVNEEDHATVLAVIHAVVTLDDNAPEVTVRIGPPSSGYYSLVFDKYNGWVNLWDARDKMEKRLGSRAAYIKGLEINPKTGNIVARVEMLSTGTVALNTRDEMSGRKRLRPDNN